MVTEAENSSLQGIQGMVIDETKNTLTIQTSKGVKKLIKSQVTLKTDQETIKGIHIQKRPDEIK